MRARVRTRAGVRVRGRFRRAGAPGCTPKRTASPGSVSDLVRARIRVRVRVRVRELGLGLGLRGGEGSTVQRVRPCHSMQMPNRLGRARARARAWR